MTDFQEPPLDPSALEEAARRVVESGRDVKNAIRGLAVDALGRGRLTAERTGPVIRALAHGAARGAAAETAETKAALAEAMAGLEEALGMTATATRLAIEEAAGNLKEFATSDLRRAIDDLIALEQLFFESMSEVGHGARGAGAAIWADLVTHARRTGTAFGGRAREAGEILRGRLSTQAARGVRAGTDAAISMSARLARNASSILADLAGRLEPERTPPTPATPASPAPPPETTESAE